MIRAEPGRFVDDAGRTVMLRGVNLGGSSKVPFTPDGATWRREHFFEHRTVSFVGRPFPLEEADEHFARLKSWGLTTLRFLVTWEAIEHAGLRQYDAAYLEYLEQVVRRAGTHGFAVFIDFHQDVWSRFTGGDGAPGWTLEAVGFQLEHLHETGAAFVHCMHEGPLPRMIWPSNAGKLAAGTMFSLFWGGAVLAPSRRIDGVNAQHFLQEHFLGAVEAVTRRLARIDCVFGYDVMNEPAVGWIGWDDLQQPHGPVWLGALPSPLESMALGDGQTRDVDVWERDAFGKRVTGKTTVNPRGARAWRDGVSCVWRDEGVWDFGAHGDVRLLRPDAFTHVDGRAISFQRDFYKPFLKTALERVRRHAPKSVFFIEAEPFKDAPSWSPADGENVAYAPHWYDGVVLFLKRFIPVLGVDAWTEEVVPWPLIRRSYREQLLNYVHESNRELNGMPVLLGEFGIAFDLNDRKAFGTGDFSEQSAAMDRTMVALEDAGLSGTLWNYTSNNTHQHGDLWNEEDLSIYSREDGGRALDAVVRPYPRALAGTLISSSYQRRNKRYELTFTHRDDCTAPSEIFVPRLHFPNGVNVQVSDGTWTLEGDVLTFTHDPNVTRHTLSLSPRGDGR